VLAIEEQSLRFNSEQGVGSEEQSFQFKIELSKDTDCIILSEEAELEVPIVNIDVDVANKEEDDIGDEGGATTTETRADAKAARLSYTPTQQSKK
jgi:hypothetical protein